MDQRIKAPRGRVAGSDFHEYGDVTCQTAGGHIINNHIERMQVCGDAHLHAPAAINIHTCKVKMRFDYAASAGPEHLDDAQKGRLRELVNEIVRLEATVSRRPKRHGTVWSALASKAKVPSYHRILAADFERCERYLQTWLARLRAQPTAVEKDPDWRNSRYRYIHGALREIGRLDELPALLQARYSGRTLNELSKLELETVYRIVAEWKKQARQHGAVAPDPKGAGA